MSVIMSPSHFQPDDGYDASIQKPILEYFEFRRRVSNLIFGPSFRDKQNRNRKEGLGNKMDLDEPYEKEFSALTSTGDLYLRGVTDGNQSRYGPDLCAHFLHQLAIITDSLKELDEVIRSEQGSLAKLSAPTCD